MTDDYRFRWYCGPCDEAGGWHKSYEAAKETEQTHIEGHDELLYEPTRIQRYPATEVADDGG